MLNTLKNPPPPNPFPRPELTCEVMETLMEQARFTTEDASLRRDCMRLGIRLAWSFCARLYSQYMNDQFAQRLAALQKQNQALVGIIIDMTAQDRRDSIVRIARQSEELGEYETKANACIPENPAKKHDGGEL